MGSYFWGYLITQVPGGRISELYGGKWVFWIAVFLNVFAMLLSPICAYGGYHYLIIMRIIKGLGAGVTFPAMNVLISKWAPQDERSTITAMVYGGMSVYLHSCIAAHTDKKLIFLIWLKEHHWVLLSPFPLLE